MGLFKKFLPEGWVDEEVPGAVASSKQASPVASKPAPIINLSSTPKEEVEVVDKQTFVPTATQSFSIINPDKPDPEYLKFIDDFLERENLPGVDYYEYKSAVREMIEGGTPVEQAFRNTFTALRATGLTVEKLLERLIETNSYYQGKLEGLQKDFEADADNLVSTEEGEVKKTSAQISDAQLKLIKEEADIQKRLVQIKEEREANEKSLQKVTSELDKVKNAQQTRKAKMGIANAFRIGVIKDDAQKIQIYLTGK